MPVLRELVSRFSFETDKRSVKGYEDTIGRMKRSAKGLGALLGVSLGGKAIFDIGVSAVTAEENLKKTAGVRFDSLQNNLKTVRAQLDAVREGAGDIITDKDFDIMTQGFIQVFGTANEDLMDMNKLMVSVGKEAITSGGNVVDLFAAYVAGAETGGLGILSGTAGLTKSQTQRISDLLAQQRPGEFGGEIGRKQGLSQFARTVSEISEEQNRALRATSDEFFRLQITTKEVNQGLDSLSETIFTRGVGVINTLFKMSESLKSDFERIKEGGDIIQDEDKSFFFKDKNNGSENKPLDGSGTVTNNIEVKTTNNFNGMTNEKEIANEVKKQHQKIIDDAGNQIIRGEQK